MKKISMLLVILVMAISTPAFAGMFDNHNDFKNAEICLKQVDKSCAVDYLKAIISRDRGNAKALRMLGEYFLSKSHLDTGYIIAAEKQFDNYLTIKPGKRTEVAMLFKAKGDTLFDSNSWQANQCYLRAKKFQPNLAKILADKFLEKATSLNEKDAVNLYRKVITNFGTTEQRNQAIHAICMFAHASGDKNHRYYAEMKQYSNAIVKMWQPYIQVTELFKKELSDLNANNDGVVSFYDYNQIESKVGDITITITDITPGGTHELYQSVSGEWEKVPKGSSRYVTYEITAVSGSAGAWIKKGDGIRFIAEVEQKILIDPVKATPMIASLP